MRYNSDKAGEEFSDMKSLEGPLNRIFEEAYSFVVRNTPSVSHFREGQPQREDHPLYPEAAVREGLINALAHRDYTSPSGGVAIHIYPRRLEIWNSGTLPEGITNESLRKGQISVLRNPDIAHVLYLRGFMEKAGRGSVLIIDACRRQGLPEPNWNSNQSRGVTLTFFAVQVTTQVTPEVKRLLKHLKGEMSRQELQDAMGLKSTKHFRKAYLLPALEMGVIEMTIPEKPRSGNQKYRRCETETQLLAPPLLPPTE
jgi:ATP-dependent DNA helicase RecG